MYADDNAEFLVFASDEGSTTLPATTPDVKDNYAWCWSHLDFSPSNRGNYDPTADITRRPLWPFLNNTNVEKYPADPSYVVVSGAARPRVRSVSLNMFLGGFAPAAAGGGMLGNDGGNATADPYNLYHKMSDLDGAASLVPADTLVFLDERADFINWGSFVVDMAGYGGQPGLYSFAGDLPAMYHEGAANVCFADGHAASKRWPDPRTTPPMAVPVTAYGSATSFASPNNVDVAWLQQHATRPK